MNHRWSRTAGAIVLALLFGGCRGVVQQDLWAVGTCVQVIEGRGTNAVGCSEPHTHKVIAIADRAEECPSQTHMFSQPADPDDGLTTTWFQSHTATE